MFTLLLLINIVNDGVNKGFCGTLHVVGLFLCTLNYQKQELKSCKKQEK